MDWGGVSLLVTEINEKNSFLSASINPWRNKEQNLLIQHLIMMLIILIWSNERAISLFKYILHKYILDQSDMMNVLVIKTVNDIHPLGQLKN